MANSPVVTTDLLLGRMTNRFIALGPDFNLPRNLSLNFRANSGKSLFS
jgi:hypothetical protein